ncbi:hypothetical protein AGIG_G11666 [Arapaima gigas]
MLSKTRGSARWRCGDNNVIEFALYEDGGGYAQDFTFVLSERFILKESPLYLSKTKPERHPSKRSFDFRMKDHQR